MSIKVRIPSPLRTFTNGADIVEVPGTTVSEVLNGLIAKAAGIETRLFKTPGQLNRFVNVYVNDEDVRFLSNLETPVKDGDEVAIVPAIAGGNAGQVSKRCWLTFPSRNQVEQPIIWRMSQAFPKVVFDIRQSSVQNEIGIMAVLFVGPADDVVKALAFLREAGLTVEPIEKSVVEG